MHVDAATVAELLDRASLIDALEAAFREGCEAPRRHHHAVPTRDGGEATLLLMPAWVAGRYLGVKVASVFPGNGPLGLPSVQSVYLLCSGRTGELLATIDGAELTTRRTVAASSLAARFLARPDASRLLIVGTGRVARQLAASHAAVRLLRDVAVWGRDGEAARRLAHALARDGIPARPASDLEAEVRRSDIVSCCTLSRAPLVLGDWLRPGVHLDLIGGFTPEMREVDDAAVACAVTAVDTGAALVEAGDLAGPLARGVIDRTRVVADLADLASGRHPGRRRPDEVTLFKSVGTAIEDLAAAVLCYERARPAQA